MNNGPTNTFADHGQTITSLPELAIPIHSALVHVGDTDGHHQSDQSSLPITTRVAIAHETVPHVSQSNGARDHASWCDPDTLSDNHADSPSLWANALISEHARSYRRPIAIIPMIKGREEAAISRSHVSRFKRRHGTERAAIRNAEGFPQPPERLYDGNFSGSEGVQYFRNSLTDVEAMNKLALITAQYDAGKFTRQDCGGKRPRPDSPLNHDGISKTKTHMQSSVNEVKAQLPEDVKSNSRPSRWLKPPSVMAQGPSTSAHMKKSDEIETLSQTQASDQLPEDKIVENKKNIIEKSEILKHGKISRNQFKYQANDRTQQNHSQKMKKTSGQFRMNHNEKDSQSNLPQLEPKSETIDQGLGTESESANKKSIRDKSNNRPRKAIKLAKGSTNLRSNSESLDELVSDIKQAAVKITVKERQIPSAPEPKNPSFQDHGLSSTSHNGTPDISVASNEKLMDSNSSKGSPSSPSSSTPLTQVDVHVDKQNAKGGNQDQSQTSRNLPAHALTDIEESSLLRRIAMHKSTIFHKPKVYVQTRYDVGYNGQAQELELAFQKLKNSESSTSNGPESSIMKSLKIPPKYLKKSVEDALSDAFQGIHFRGEPRRSDHKRLHTFAKSTIQQFFEMWGEENVLEWEDRKLNMIIMARLALELNLDHKEAHYGISPVLERTVLYDQFTKISPKENAQFTAAVQKILGKEESTRRLVAFFTLGLNSRDVWTLRRSAITHRDPQACEELLKRREGSIGRIHIGRAIAVIYGPSEGEKRLKLVEYLRKRDYRREWWKPFGLEAASKHFRLDVLKLLKIGDLLQFGSNYLLDDVTNRHKIDIAYTQLLELVTDQESVLPWMESPERAWLTGHWCIVSGSITGSQPLGIQPRFASQNAFRNPRRADRFKQIVLNLSDYEKKACSVWHRVFWPTPLDSPSSAYQSFIRELGKWWETWLH
ncbi:hypothetical protein H4Q26_015842 [Puccinia striiformis f. sp. tritici PST-130]|nr:hypothetical protein H4Q26_015842 [Puccinia striiformis f. sp. tritici PST-130]